MGTPDIKVITGVGRCGKSKLLEAFAKYVMNSEDSNIIHINFNLPEYEELLSYRALYDYINSKYKEDSHNYVLIDEVQMCEDFEKAINGLHASEKYDIYITGSNAFLLSSDLATLFTGRTFEIKVTPLLQIKDAYPKILIARTKYEEYQYEGVRVIDIANWLIDG